jgi:hypothetical protein
MGQHLLRTGLADVDYCLAAEMPRGHKFGHHGSSPTRGRRGH